MPVLSLTFTVTMLDPDGVVSVVGFAVTVTTYPVTPVLRTVIVTALKDPLERTPCTVSWTEVPVKFVPDL
jgi:hypothetical protein